MEGVLSTLGARERGVLRMRYGLDDGRPKTLEEIGVAYAVTRERIRQIEAKALLKLRQPARAAALADYADDAAGVGGAETSWKASRSVETTHVAIPCSSAMRVSVPITSSASRVMTLRLR